MSTLSGVSSKGEKGKSKFQSLDINSIYHKTNKGESSEQQQAKSTVPRKHGMQSLGKVPSTRRAPVNLPSLKSEHSGSDPSVSLVPTGGTGWGSKTSDLPPITSTSPVTTSGPTQVTNVPAAVGTAPVQQTSITPTPPQQPPKPTPVVSTSGDKTWSSVAVGGVSGEGVGPPNAGSGPSFLAHQSPQFQAEFPSLPGEGGVPGPPRPPDSYGPGPSLRPQTEGSWVHGGGFQPPPPPSSTTRPPFPPALPTVPSPTSIVPQYKGVVPPFLLNHSGSGGFPAMFPGNFQNSLRPKFHSGTDNRYSSGSRPPPLSDPDDLIARPIIREEDLNRMDEISRDSGWATQDDIDYNQKLAFSDEEGQGNDDDKDVKNKTVSNQSREEKKDNDTEKENRDKISIPDKSNLGWQGRSQSIPQPEFRSPLTKLPQSNTGREMDMDDVWKEKRRQQVEQVAAVTEKAKQRKEEEEKRFEETRSKSESDKKKKEESELEPENEKKDQGETFRQLTQLDSRNFSRGDSQSNFNRFHTPLPPRFQKQQYSLRQQQGSPSETRWGSQHYSSGKQRLRGDSDEAKEKDDEGGRRDHNTPEPTDRFRSGSNRPERDYELNKKNTSYDKKGDSHRNYQHDFKDCKEIRERDNEMEWEGRRGGSTAWEGPRSSEETSKPTARRDNKKASETFNKAHSVFDEHDGEWRDNRDRPVRPDSRDSRASRDSRTSREESRNIADSVNSDYSWAEPDYEKEVHEEKPRRKDNYKDDRRDTQSHSRREGHVPGPITREKMEAYEHKQIMAEVFKAEKKELMNSSSTENKLDDDLWKPNDAPTNSNWAESPDERQQLDQKHSLTQCHQSSQLSSIIQNSQKVVLVQAKVAETPSPLIGSNVNEETTIEKASKDDSTPSEKKFQGSGPVSLKEKEKGSGRGSGRSGRGSNRHNYNSPNFNVFYRGSSSSNWSSNKETAPRRGPPKPGKPWNISESEGSGDEISASTESGKEDKKIERKQAPRSPKTGGERKKDKDDRNKESKKNESTIKASDNNNPGRKPPSVTQSGGQGGGFSSGGGFEGGRKEGFLPRGEPSRRGRGGGAFRAPGGRGPAPAHYGPPGSKPAFPAPSASSKDDDPNDSSSEEKKKPVITGRKEQRKSDSDSSRSNKGKGGKVKREHDDWETTSEGSDSETKGKPRQNKKLLHSRTGGEKRNVFSLGQVNGRPRSEEGKQSTEKGRGSKDEEDSSSRFINHSDIFPSNNGFQEVRSKKTGKEGKPLGKDELKRSRGKEKGNKGPPGVSKPGTQGKSYPREWNNKPPRMQRQLMLQQQQQQQQQLQTQPTDSVSDMNKLNQNISMFPLRDVSCPAPAPPPPVNAWDKPITAALRTSSPPANLHHLAPSIPNPQEKNVIEINDHGPSGGSSQTSSPNAEKALSKIGRETVEKSFLDGTTPPVQTIVFENTNLKAPSDALKTKYPLKTQRIEKGRDRKLEEELDENSHIGLGSFKPGTEIKANETKTQETIQMPMSFSKSEDTADMKLDFHFESDLSHLTEDKPNIPRSIHQVLVQSSAADLNQKIASVKKVWETPTGSISMMEHQHHDEVVSTSSSSFTPNFGSTVDSLDHSHQITSDDSTFPSDVYTTQNSSSNRQNYFIISGPQIQGSTQGYTNTGNNIIKADPSNPNSNVCKVKPQPQQAVISSTIGTHSGQSLSSPPPFNQQGHYGFQTPYNNMPAIPSPPAVIINSGPAAGAQQVPPNHQADLYHSFPINGPTMISSGAARSGFSQYPYGLGQGLGSTSGYSQGNLYLPQPTAPPASDVFQSLSQFRLQPSAAPAYGQSQQMNNNPSTVLMTSSSNSLMSASVKSSVQPPLGAIGSKAGFQSSAHPSQVQLSYISYDPASMLPQNFLQSSQIVQRHGANNVVPAIQPTTSYYSSSTGGQTGLFQHGSSILAGTAGSQPAALHNATAFGMQGFGAQSATAPAQPTSSNPVGVQSYSSQMGQFRAQAPGGGGSPYLKTSTNPPTQHTADPSKSPSTNQDLVNSVFSGGGGGGQIPSPKSRAGGGKQPQPPQQPSPTQPPHPKFTPYQTQQNLVMQQGNGGRGPPIGQQGVRTGSNNGNGLSNNGVNRYPTPIQRPVVAYQGIQQGGRHRGPLRPQPSHHLKMPATQYYSHQGGSVKLDGEGKEGEGKLAEGKGEKKEEQTGGSEQ